MNAESNKAVKPDESRDTKQTVDQSRRSFAKAGVVAPVIMTLTSKTAMGQTPYWCTVSGQQSGNLSSHGDPTTCKLGFSPGAWKTPANDGDGNIDQWLTAEVNPMTIGKKQNSSLSGNGSTDKGLTSVVKLLKSGEKSGSSQSEDGVFGCFKGQNNEEWKYGDELTFGNLKAKDMYDKIKQKGFAEATPFNTIFKGSSDVRSLHTILTSDEGSLEFHAIADYLNAALNLKTGIFSPIYDDITPDDIVSIYNDSSLSDDAKKNYFIMIHE